MALDEKDADVVLSGAGTGEPLREMIGRNVSRRAFLKAVGLTVAATAVASHMPAEAAAQAGAAEALGAGRALSAGLPFDAIKPQIVSSARTVVAKDHTVSVLLRWGDPLFKDAPAFDAKNLTAAAQEKQFGYNNDFVGVLPHPDDPNNAERGIMVVNHEYTNPELMWNRYNASKTTKDIVDVELAAHGMSVVEIVRKDGQWRYVQDSKYNRRLTGTTPIAFDGPAAGSDWLKTAQDPTGLKVAGTLNNCAAGKTPWGTILTAEENFHQYFANLDALQDEAVKALHSRYGLPTKNSERRWETIYDRFDIAISPNEPFRFGWIMEVDPYDPASTPVKRTAMGRVKHEAATFALAKDGRGVFYSGDDERFEYVYKFVSQGKYSATDRKANLSLLADGTLYVATFNEDGSGEWKPLVFGQGPLTAANGFTSQADVCVLTRQASDLLGATKMDRPEDIETNPVNKKVYIALTNNSNRGAQDRPGPDAANPRPNNRTGHIIEVTEAGDDPAATTFQWNIFILCGNPKTEDPSKPETITDFAGFDKSKVSPIGAPDNITFDKDGNLWIATDGQPSAIRYNDGLFAVPVEGSNRGELKQFFSTVMGSEVCGPEFYSGDTVLFVAIQHPGEGSFFHLPSTRWPDNRRSSPPRPSVLAIQNKDPKKRVGGF